jgi:hypothetical protein
LSFVFSTPHFRVLHVLTRMRIRTLAKVFCFSLRSFCFHATFIHSFVVFSGPGRKSALSWRFFLSSSRGQESCGRNMSMPPFRAWALAKEGTVRSFIDYFIEYLLTLMSIIWSWLTSKLPLSQLSDRISDHMCASNR